MVVKTNKTDVISTFARYYGRQPSSTEDLKTVEYLTTKAPQEVESLLAKNSPITSGKLWADYQKTVTPAPVVQPISTVTPEQKKQLDVVASKPVESQSQTDKDNIKYATEKLGYVAPTTPAPVADTPVNSNTNTEISNEDKKWVNDLYSKYFDRTATSAELANWAAATPAALEQFLGAEQKKYAYTSNAMGADNKARYDAAMKEIDASELPTDIKNLWKQVVGMYPNSKDFDTTEIINTFNTIKNNTIDPYYKELADVALKDVQTQVDQLNATRASELEAEKANAQTAVKNAQGTLESTGMTFSGKGVEQLGTGSAYAATPTAETPVATPFGGIDPAKLQGSVGQSNRLISTSTAAKYAADQQAIGRKAEDFLGGNSLSNINGLTYKPAGVNLTGSNAIAAETKKASTLQDIITQWRNKQNSAQNI